MTVPRFNRQQRRLMASRHRKGDPKAQEALSVLRQHNDRLDDGDYLEELEANNREMTAQLQVVSEVIEPEIADLPNRLNARQLIRDLQQRVELLEARRPDIKHLPRDLVGVLDLVEQIYPDRITFTTDARKSARTAAMQEVHICWRMLRAIATTLHGLYGTGVDLRTVFQAQSGFELALTRRRLPGSP